MVRRKIGSIPNHCNSEHIIMKRQTILGIAFSVFALNAFAATETDPLFSDAVAATETDPLFSDAVASDGSDHLQGNRVAEGGADRLLERRTA